MTRPVRWLVGLVVLATMAAGTYFLLVYRQEIIDRWRLLSYKPSAEIAALADSATMDGRGRDLFYASDPQIDEREQFNNHCTDTGEESLVLGCYSAQSIYIYNITDKRLNGVKEVTAAHEMLHAAYERLQEGEKQRINQLLTDQLAKIRDTRLDGLIVLYSKEEPGELANEMHSILGTEFGNLLPELETYYKQYFSDRAKLVAFASNYATTFTGSQNRIADYDKRLDDLKKQIDASTSELDARKASLDSQSAQLESVKNSDPNTYNSLVPSFNANVRTYNSLASKTRNLVAQYNELVVARNNEVAVQNDLYHSLDSNYQAVSTD